MIRHGEQDMGKNELHAISMLQASTASLAFMQPRAVAAYLGLAIGDALGATVEFMTPREIRALFGTHDEICGGGWLRLKPGQVTDDTTMSLALGQSILSAGGIDALNVAQAFDAWMRAKPVDIGNTVRRGIGGGQGYPAKHRGADASTSVRRSRR